MREHDGLDEDRLHDFALTLCRESRRRRENGFAQEGEIFSLTLKQNPFSEIRGSYAEMLNSLSQALLS